MIFVDSNIPMYLIGTSHRHKADAQRILERLIAERESLVTDAEVFQEILHRYVAISRREAIRPAFDSLLGIVDEVLPIELVHVARARALVSSPDSLSARDAVHVAVMEEAGIDRILSFDAGFDQAAGIVRIFE